MSYDPPLSIEKTADGAINANGETVIAQISPAYGIIDSTTFTTESGTGAAVTVASDLFFVTAGTDADGVAAALTNRLAKYRSGQGVVCRLTAIFEEGAIDQQQLAGFIESSSGAAFAMVSGIFGVLHYYSGEPEQQKLEVTSAAVAPEQATVTINGVGYPVDLTAGTTVNNAAEIADQLDVPGYIITANQSTVTAQAVAPGAAGTFDFTSATAVAAWTQTVPGEPIVSDFVPQEQWNSDTADWINPAALNSYEVEFSDCGNIKFKVYDPETGEHVLAHQVEWLNSLTEPPASQSAFRGGWAVQNFGATTAATIRGASCGVFNQGVIRLGSTFRVVDNDQLDIGTDLTSVLIVRNRASFGPSINRSEILPALLTASTQADKPAFLEVRVNPDFDAEVDFEYLDEAQSLIEFSKQSVGVSGGDLKGSTVVGLQPLQLRFGFGDSDVSVTPGDVICIAVRMSAPPASDVQAALTMLEDI